LIYHIEEIVKNNLIITFEHGKSIHNYLFEVTTSCGTQCYFTAQSLIRALFQSPRQTWGLIDCISFVVMSEQSLTDAVTANIHFVQAGFRALLLESKI
jgi:hypothetical protein